MKVIYVAGPFRGKTAWEVAENVRRAERLGYEVARLGLMPLIPHANTAHFDGELTADFWLEGTMELLRRSDAVIFTPDWERSSGARAEEAEAKRLGIFRFYSIAELESELQARSIEDPLMWAERTFKVGL